MSVHEMNAPPANKNAGKPAVGSGKPGPGRPKGRRNKLTLALKDMILQSLANVGGAKYLEEQAHKQPAAYMALIGRVLPLQVKDGGTEPQVPAPVQHVHEHVG